MRWPATLLLVVSTAALADSPATSTPSPSPPATPATPTPTLTPVNDERCGVADVDAICRASRFSLTAGPNPLDAPTIAANTTYEVAAFTANKRSYMIYKPQVTGEFALYYSASAAKVCDEHVACSSAAPSCMRAVATYVLVEGERYEIELGPIAPTQRVLLHLAAPTDEEHIASR